ncbi:DUF6881 domain-containing protein [Streptomyces sp. NPDC098789]|uniref:DUF6881 domain-containing protein n=1 Tax=Streptomyces sp. NPDC098789 TaxID=3366098 RepID=UPI00381DEED0
MEYWRVEWLTGADEDPATIWSEIRGDGYEARKVHRYRDGRFLRSDEYHESREMGLSEVPVGDIEEINNLPDFAATSVTREDFEEAWRDAVWCSP